MYETTGVDTSRWGDLLAIWGPRILGAIAILLVAWFVGKLVKGALAKGVDKFPALKHHNEGKEPRSTAGAKLGDVAYWLVLLIGVVAALNVLNLGGVAGPLNTMLNQFFAFIPNVIGALLIFFVGFIVATIAKRLVTAALQAAGADGWAQKLGLTKTSGVGTGISSALGTLVFVLVIIPVAIAALNALQIEAISRPAVAVLSTILSAIPLVLAAAIVLAIGFFLGRWVAGVVEKVLPATGFDKSVGGLTSAFGGGRPSPRAASAPTPSNLGAGQSTIVSPSEPGAASPSASGPAAAASAASSSGSVTPSKIVAQIVMWAIVAFSAVEAARLLQFGTLAETFETILALAGSVIVGALIITAGVLIAQVLSRAIDKGTQGRDGFASDIVKWATIALATAMGLSFMGIADEIVTLAFGLILGSAAVAAAIAFGLGGREAAGRVADRWAEQMQNRPAPAPRQPSPSEPEPRPFTGGQPGQFQ
jgi:hypothetical protein